MDQGVRIQNQIQNQIQIQNQNQMRKCWRGKGAEVITSMGEVEGKLNFGVKIRYRIRIEKFLIKNIQ